jgi:hypothetical protein
VPIRNICAIGAISTRPDEPVTHVDASCVRSHFDAMEVGLNDAPKADELAPVPGMTTGPRVHDLIVGVGVEPRAGRRHLGARGEVAHQRLQLGMVGRAFGYGFCALREGSAFQRQDGDKSGGECPFHALLP